MRTQHRDVTEVNECDRYAVVISDVSVLPKRCDAKAVRSPERCPRIPDGRRTELGTAPTTSSGTPAVQQSFRRSFSGYIRGQIGHLHVLSTFVFMAVRWRYFTLPQVITVSSFRSSLPQETSYSAYLSDVSGGWIISGQPINILEFSTIDNQNCKPCRLTVWIRPYRTIEVIASTKVRTHRLLDLSFNCVYIQLNNSLQTVQCFAITLLFFFILYSCSEPCGDIDSIQLTDHWKTKIPYCLENTYLGHSWLRD